MVAHWRLVFLASASFVLSALVRSGLIVTKVSRSPWLSERWTNWEQT